MRKKILFILFLGIIQQMVGQVVVVPGEFPTVCQSGDFYYQTKPIIIKETLPTDFATTLCSGGYFIVAHLTIYLKWAQV